MKKILITGATGFAGSFLAEYLVSQHATVFGTYLSESSIKNVASIRKKLSLHKVNLLSFDEVTAIVEKIQPDEVYHLAALTSAAESFKHPAETITNNITAQMHILEALKQAKLFKCRIFITSSAEIYGHIAATDLPIDEETPLRPVSPYGVSKIAQDYLALEYFLAHKMPIIRVRPFNHIGPRQSSHFVVASFARQIAEIEKNQKSVAPTIRVGNLEARRDFTDVRDMVSAYAMLMEKGIAGDVYNIGSGQSQKIRDVLETLISFAKVKVEVEVDKTRFRPIDTPDMYADVAKLFATTGWKPQISFEQTLRETLEYWRGIV